MSARPKLTDTQIAWARYIANRRREVKRDLGRLPTLEDVAEKLGCSKRYLEMLISNRARTIPRETSVTANNPG